MTVEKLGTKQKFHFMIQPRDVQEKMIRSLRRGRRKAELYFLVSLIVLIVVGAGIFGLLFYGIFDQSLIVTILAVVAAIVYRIFAPRWPTYALQQIATIDTLIGELEALLR